MLFLALMGLKLEYATIIAAFLTGIVGPSLLIFLRYYFKNKNTEKELRKKDFLHTLEIQKIINDCLNALQNKYNLDRVWLSQFHNGGNYYPGNKGMKKMSVSFESTAPGISSDIMKMQNLPISFFSSLLQKLSEGEESLIVNVDSEEDNALQSFWGGRGINSVYLFPIICIRGGFIGILGIDFVKREGFLDEETHDHIKTTAHLFSGYVASLCGEDHK